MTTATQARIPTEIQRRFWRAEDRMLAARVPDADRNGPGREPVAVSGYYEVPTVSGRPAWAYYAWTDGRCSERHCTYNTHAEQAVVDLIVAGADPLWRQES